jgi:hypothetical protein
MSQFKDSTIEHFKAFAEYGDRDQVIREMSEYIYTDCSWKSGYDRSVLLEDLVNQVYNQ